MHILHSLFNELKEELDIPYKVAYFHTAVHRTTFANPMLTRLRQRTRVRLQLP